ncbi:MAG: DUF169 domain-containing protein [Actinomycetota bacterium]|nr:DUF169 domain-containing protein [Actinomycetota bacterium]
MRYTETADRIAALLELELAPVALGFVDEPPAGVETTAAAVPSACAFWRQAERGVFYAPAQAHFNCPIGAMVMGFDLSEPAQADLSAAVDMMCEVAYIGADEPANIPTVKEGKGGIVYGPLRDFPLEPDVAIVWVGPQQAMLVSEASGTTSWMERASRTVFGRPACASLPSALDAGRPVLSLGCTGMRTFTEILPDRLLGVIPGRQLEDFARSLEATVEANRRMRSYYERQSAGPA